MRVIANQRRDGKLRAVAHEVGWALVALGCVALLLVVYLAWGTRILEARSQAGLKRNFDAAVASARQVERDEVQHRQLAELARTVTSGPSGAIDRLQIPAIGADDFVVNGVSEQDLALGPGHYPGTALPGQFGNAAIAGHRTTYGAPFYALDELRVGEEILVTNRGGQRFVYRVARPPFVVPPSDVAVLAPTRTPQLTLTTCTPRYWATSRLVVVARLATRPAVASQSVASVAAVVLPAVTSGQQPAPWPLAVLAPILVVLWLVIRVAARARRGWRRALVVAGSAGLTVVVLWFAFPLVVASLPLPS